MHILNLPARVQPRDSVADHQSPRFVQRKHIWMWDSHLAQLFHQKSQDHLLHHHCLCLDNLPTPDNHPQSRHWPQVDPQWPCECRQAKEYWCQVLN